MHVSTFSMQLSVPEFWKLAAASQLLSPEECEGLAAEFASMKGAAGQANVRSLAQWLIARGTLTKYQATVLAAGRPGPFVFGPFVVVDRIDSGRLARLHRATYEGSQPVLLVFLRQLTEDRREYELYAEQSQIAAAIKHPHVSRTYRATRQGSQAFIVVESLAGDTLQSWLSDTRFDIQTACQIGFQVALGLVALHGQKRAHGGVSPHNIWIDEHGAAKLMQFPLVQPASRLKRFELPLVEYLAPEWTVSEAKATHLVDIYALGCVVYQLIAGRTPFPGGSTKQKIARHRAEFPQRLDELNREVPEELADLIAEMLAKDPLLRCQSATEAAHLLARFAASPGGRATPPKLDAKGLTPGYGAWKAPDWRPPPQEAPRRKRPAAKSAPTENATIESKELPTTEPVESASVPKHEQPPSSPVSEPKGSSSETQSVREDKLTIVINTNEDQDKQTEPKADEAPTLFVVTEPQESVAPAQSTTIRSRTVIYAIGGGLGLTVLIALVLGWYFFGGDAATKTSPPTTIALERLPSPTPAFPTDEATLPDSEENSNLVDDDGATLWAAPTSGQPLDLTYLPSGAQLILALRPADLLNSPEGPKMVAALGPAGTTAIDQLQQTIGLSLSEIEQLIVGFIPGDDLSPQANYVVKLREAVPHETWLQHWNNPAPAEHAEKEYFRHDSLAYYLPETGSNRVAAIGPEAMLKEMLELDGQPLLRSGVEDLLRYSDSRRQITVIFTPSYLLTDGRDLLVGHLSQLHHPLRAFLDESIKAVLFSADVGNELFLEFRAVAPVDRRPLELKELLASRWNQIPEQVESYVASLQPQAYGRLLIHRFPRMVQLARDYTRSGVEDGQVVLSSYLPAAAAHNLLMGAELTLLEAGGVSSTIAESSPATQPRTASDALGRKISLSFPREALDRAVEVLSRELGVPVVILGADLQLEGITKNQSLNNVDERNQPADVVLRKILKLANPDGKLVYQIKPDDDGQETIFITTRAAIQKRGEKLPPGF